MLLLSCFIDLIPSSEVLDSLFIRVRHELIDGRKEFYKETTLEGEIQLAVSHISTDPNNTQRNKLIDSSSNDIPMIYGWTVHYGYYVAGLKKYFLSYCRIFNNGTGTYTGKYYIRQLTTLFFN